MEASRLGCACGVALAFFFLAKDDGWGQGVYLVNTTASSGAGSLTDAIAQANAGLYSQIEIKENLGTISLTSQLFVNANVSIDGKSNTIDMGASDRAFFIAGGAVLISDLTIQNGSAAGGDGSGGGGGGAGLGGAIFVANGQAISPAITRATNVTLERVQFVNNSARGGAGAETATERVGGGGGGMGGNGGDAYTGMVEIGGGGGGGFGKGASGGDSNPDGSGDGGTGAFLGGASAGDGSTGALGGSGGYGGQSGGGGGGAKASGDIGDGGGGGGGVGGGDGSTSSGGNGGFGGGGGGSGGEAAGNGGFGGGGGGGLVVGNTDYNTSAGGFGGGGGWFYLDHTHPVLGGPGGFGGGTGGYYGASDYGGGGMGAGGAVFVMAGATLTIVDSSFSGSAVTGGTGSNGGSAVGQDIFLGADTTISVGAGNTETLTNLGGAGNPLDVNITNHADDPNAQGGIIKAGLGTLVMSGSQNFYSGATVIHQGALRLDNQASEIGTSSVVVGQVAGDAATLTFGDGANLQLKGFPGGKDVAVMVAQEAGSTGTIVIGGGAGSAGAYLGMREITGGAGDGTIIFDQATSADGSSPEYLMLVALTGRLGVQQNGPGITVLTPGGAGNTYTGGTVVNAGTLRLGSQNALLGGGDMTVNAGTLDIQGYDVTLGKVVVYSGSIIGTGSVTADLFTFTDGASTVSAVLAGAGSLLHEGAGTTVLSADNQYTGSTIVDAGRLVQQGSTRTMAYTVNAGGTLEIDASGQALPFTSVFQGGVLEVVGINNTVTADVSGGKMVVTGAGLGGALTLDTGGELQLGAGVNVSSMAWQKGSTVSLALGSGVMISAGVFELEEYGQGQNLFAFTLAPGVEAGDVFTLVTFQSQQGFTVNDFGFSSSQAGLEGDFELSDSALTFTVSAVPEPSGACLVLVGGALVLGCGLLRRSRRLRAET